MKCDTDDDMSFAPHLLCESHDKSGGDDTNDNAKTDEWTDFRPGRLGVGAKEDEQ